VSKNKDRWKPHTWGTTKRNEIGENLEIIRGMTRALERSITRNSINMDIDYNNLFTAVDDMYKLLELDKLALDNQRRQRAHKQKVREAENARDKK
jgi:hypothetical protein